MLKKILDERPVSARDRNGALKPEVAIILEKLLEKQSERRFYPSASALAEDLRNVYHQRPIRAREYTRDERRGFELYDSLQAQAATWNAEQRPRDLLWGEERADEMRGLGLARQIQISHPCRPEFYESDMCSRRGPSPERARTARHLS